MNGRTIRIYLADGSATSLFTAEIINWTGKIISAPRSQLATLLQRTDIQRTGVYILAGPDPETPLKEQVYIGESDKVLQRLLQHNKDVKKDFWERTLIIISKDENLTKAHVRYLESRLIQIGMQAQRATLVNGTEPPLPPLPESDVADMEYFLSQLQILLPVLGFTFALPVPTTVRALPTAIPLPATETPAPMFVLTASGAAANAQEIGGEFILLKGSTVKKRGTAALGEVLTTMRNHLIADGKLIAHEQDPELLVVTTDIPFNSPSAAAKVVTGTSVSGPLYWRVHDTQQTYRAWQDEQIAAATVGGPESADEI